MALITLAQVGEFLAGHDNYLILTHKKPDGDTIGCAAALCLALQGQGKTAWVLPNEDMTPIFAPYLAGLLAPVDYAPETVVSVDIASEGLLPTSAQGWKGKIDLAIDHHPSNSDFARLTHVESDKAACGEILYELLTGWGELTPRQADALYLALSTDTGCFVYTNTTPGTHRVAAALMEAGCDAGGINKRHFRTKSYTRLRVEARLMETMDLREEGQLALASLSLADMVELNAQESDVEDMAAFAGQLEGVRTAVTIREQPDGTCKLSVRTGAELNASAVCAQLGGGGHAAAAGCTVSGNIDQAKKAIVQAIAAVRGAEKTTG